MKKIITIALAAIISMASAAAQNSKKQIYIDYSGKPGVSAVYISPAMFKLMKAVPDIEINDQEVNFSRFIRTLEGMYILSIDEPGMASQLVRDVEKELRNGKHELLMEAVEGSETTRIYVIQKDSIISDLVLLARDGSSTSYISITGQMPLEEISKMIK
ncbi:MAG: DUF4252 domain-containing protein [Bacteroidales bacterium]|nr:DUF4252 domain-containing protein [Bacteroidales bacterium]